MTSQKKTAERLGALGGQGVAENSLKPEYSSLEPSIPTFDAIKQANINNYTSRREVDQVRVAYQWLDAQQKTKASQPHYMPLKHIIEQWAKHYVSANAVQLAANLHTEINGKYPNFNISSRLTFPRIERIGALAGRDPDYSDRYRDAYKVVEAQL